MPSKNQKPPPFVWDWEAPAVITKADVTPTHALIGMTNCYAIMIDGTERAPGTLVFKGFAGACGGDGKYHGVFRFSAAEADKSYATFTTLPNALAPVAPVSESEDADVDDSDRC